MSVIISSEQYSMKILNNFIEWNSFIEDQNNFQNNLKKHNVNKIIFTKNMTTNTLNNNSKYDFIINDNESIFNINKKTNKCMIYNKEFNCKSILLCRPINGLANRLRFLCSIITKAISLKKHIFLCWEESEGFNQISFDEILDHGFLEKYNVTLISRDIFRCMSIYANTKCDDNNLNILSKKILWNNMISIESGNNLKYAGVDIDDNLYHNICHDLMPSVQIRKLIDLFCENINLNNLYGLHIRRGDSEHFDKSKILYFVKIVESIIYNEPMAVFYLSTNCKYVQKYLKNKYNNIIIFQDKKHWEQLDDYMFKNRNKHAIYEAVFDLFMLSKTKKILGTIWSSFSDFAGKISNIPVNIIKDYNNEIHNSFKKGISIVTAVMNRTNQLKNSLKSWVELPEIDEIVIIDWSSDQKISHILNKLDWVKKSKNIKIYRVNDQKKWILTWAINLGVLLSSYETIMKLDCDIVLDKNFFKHNKIQSNTFCSGHWKNSSQRNLNGQTIFNKIYFLCINGYNENITTYGYDDDDFYNRLKKLKINHVIICDSVNNLKIMYHEDHSDDIRIINQNIKSNNLYLEIQRNKEISEKNMWNAKCTRKSYYIDNNDIWLV